MKMSQKQKEYLSRPKTFCLDSKCAYYYEEIDECMYGEPEIPANWDRRCEQDESKL